MRCTRLLTLSCLVLLEVSAAANGQRLSPDPPPPTDTSLVLLQEQDRELGIWLSAMEKWQRYDTKWSNRPAHDSLGSIAVHRPPPDAPAWLGAYCTAAAAAHVLELDPRTKVACLLLEDPRTAIAAVPTPVQAARLDAEKSKHSSFMTRVHLDGLWSTASSGTRLYGLVGSHISLVDVGRLQVFGPPGVLLMSVPDDGGSRRVTLGYTWGLSVRLTDVRLFGPTKDMTLFLNVSKVWMASGGDEQTARGYDMMGFSIASRKKR
jgi:hypothetical protein